MKQERTIMQGLASFVVRRHKLVLIAGVVLLLLSIVASQNIQVKTQIKDLLPENNPKVHSYEEINKEFGGGTTIMITIEGRDKQEMVQCAEAFVQGVRDNEKLMEYVRAINLKIDKKFMRDWGLMFQKAEDLKRTKEMLSELNLLPFITSLNDNFEREYTGTEAEEELSTSRQENEAVSMLNQLESFFVLLRDYLENPEGIPLEVQGEKLADTFLYGDQYGFNYDNTMLMFTISPNVSVVAMEKITILMDEVKKIRTSIQKQFPHLEVGYTGDVAVQSDEMAAVGFDMVFPALIALVVILVLFLFSLNQIRFIVFLLLSLVMGIVFNYGFVGISIKEINMLTSMMAVLLIGLGVDYGIQMVSNFTTFRQDGYSPEEALINTYTKAGMGVVLAALTTAIAFFVMAATGSVAFSQFGIMLGTGIIMCLIAMILILPSLLLWFGRKDITRSKLPTAEFRFVTKLGKLTYRHKWIAL
ncbi:MAG: hypothetical protein DRP87_14720 [Spirochaetes bacterium]|nr:MAG: hypothetical protein DRP87_14720 [Spirochaetota bacterium]